MAWKFEPRNSLKATRELFGFQSGYMFPVRHPTNRIIGVSRDPRTSWFLYTHMASRAWSLVSQLILGVLCLETLLEMLSYIFAAFAFFRIAHAIAVAKRQDIATLSQAQIEEFKPYSFYAAAALLRPCEHPDLVVRRRSHCAGNPTFQPSASGGDGSAVQFWYVGWDPTLSSVVVAHQGTNPTSILADLTDVDFFLTNLDSTLFPGLPSSIQVHSGFAAEHAKTARTILAHVQELLAQHGGASSIAVTGHSLGAALALLDAVYLPLHLPAGTRVRMVGYGMPRVGNAAFADHVDALGALTLTHVSNREDPVPIVPGRFMGFVHPAGEVHIRDAGGRVGRVPRTGQSVDVVHHRRRARTCCTAIF
ncbi:Alpha/Beta hydrolase protein [Lactarius hengduanensis]|nr:Alpha/Beta hydrolase protein [Lactarius hengduanensis]